jgi:hypothetical protein
MQLTRVVRHLATPPWRVRQAFPAAALSAIEAAIRDAEVRHQGQICFVVESALDLSALLSGTSARERALDVFAQQRVWDTEQNNGVLIYLLLADHDVEIVADRGIHAKVGSDGWAQICQVMEQAFRGGRFETGVIDGVRAVSAHLARHFPGDGSRRNELSDRPVVL